MTKPAYRHDRLYAKSYPSDWDSQTPLPESIYLLGHLQDVHRAAVMLLEQTADAQLRAVGLSVEEFGDRLKRIVTLAAALHDLGKCNDHFQGMLTRDGRQALRHEWVTLLIIRQREWKAWLLPALGDAENDWNLLCWAIAGHHPKYGRPMPPEAAEGPPRMTLPMSHSDMTEVATWLAETFSLEPPPTGNPIDFSMLYTSSENAFDRLASEFFDDEDDFEEFTDDERRLLGCIKDTLVAADVAGSALPWAGNLPVRQDEWIKQQFDPQTLPTSETYLRICSRRLDCEPDQVDAALRDFQKNAILDSHTEDVLLVTAGCGSGKTLFAYRWAASLCDRRRLMVCYPTTGTTTEGFRDYLLDPELAGIVETGMQHGRKRVDLRMLGVKRNPDETAARLSSLEGWRIPVLACTVDTVLGVVQNNRRGLFGWPALSQSGFVFDEIHSYDDKLFDALLHFLSIVRGVPILLMTASLPAPRVTAIRDVLSRAGRDLQLIEGPEELETLPRYRLREGEKKLVLDKAAQKKKLSSLISDEIASSGRVLCVHNTVSRVLRQAEAFRAHKPIVYHSRFRYCDRVRQHGRLIDEFKKTDPVLAIASQVAEMSLDISATMLVTDLAPIPALIQRLGRLNRYAQPGDAPLPFIVLEPLARDGKFSALPYGDDELKLAKKWLARLRGRPLHQRELIAAWKEIEEESDCPRWQSAWIDYGPATPVLELREGSPTITIVREEDLHDLQSRKLDLIEASIPMPIRPKNDWQVDDFRGVPVASAGSISYSQTEGASWAENAAAERRRPSHQIH